MGNELSFSHSVKWEKFVLGAFLHPLAAHFYGLLISLPLTSPTFQFSLALSPPTLHPTV